MEKKISMSKRSVWILLAGLVVMILGYIVMTGPEPVKEVFNYDMFDFRRLVAAPLLILAGVVVEIVAIMGWCDKKEDK